MNLALYLSFFGFSKAPFAKEISDADLWLPPSKEEVLITSLRHKEALSRAIEAVEALISGLKSGVSAEFLSSDMRHAGHSETIRKRLAKAIRKLRHPARNALLEPFLSEDLGLTVSRAFDRRAA